MSALCQGSFGGDSRSQVSHSAGRLVTCMSSLKVTLVVLASLEVLMTVQASLDASSALHACLDVMCKP